MRKKGGNKRGAGLGDTDLWIEKEIRLQRMKWWEI
jgi:hypothetical protein